MCRAKSGRRPESDGIVGYGGSGGSGGIALSTLLESATLTLLQRYARLLSTSISQQNPLLVCTRLKELRVVEDLLKLCKVRLKLFRSSFLKLLMPTSDLCRVELSWT